MLSLISSGIFHLLTTLPMMVIAIAVASFLLFVVLGSITFIAGIINEKLGRFVLIISCAIAGIMILSTVMNVLEGNKQFSGNRRWGTMPKGSHYEHLYD